MHHTVAASMCAVRTVHCAAVWCAGFGLPHGFWLLEQAQTELPAEVCLNSALGVAEAVPASKTHIRSPTSYTPLSPYLSKDPTPPPH